MGRPVRALEALVIHRANGRCEYCDFPIAGAELPFHIDHIIAEKHDGPDDFGESCVGMLLLQPALQGTTDVGRTTIQVLTINDPDSVAVRHTLHAEGLFDG